MPLHQEAHPTRSTEEIDVRPQFCRPGETGTVPRFRMPERSMSPETAYQIVHDELMLDGNARLNVATFVTTWMEPVADVLMAECSSKNMIDKDEYPQTAELEMRCLNMLADLWGSTDAGGGRATGCSTTGSSEACMLGGMALKWRWRERRRTTGRPTDAPNLVMGTNVQVCWDKFCRYWEVEPRLVPVGDGGATHLTADRAAAACDENTIGVVAILGSTFDGTYEPVAEIAAALDALESKSGIDVPIHVDAASGGFIAPFIDQDLVWDFRLPRVQSINSSGHKFGLVYPGVGWIVWRDADALPEDLVFKVDYLGGEMPTFALNFSRPGAQVAAQYYSFLRLGQEGYRRVRQSCRDTARWLASGVAEIGPFELVSDGSALPVIAFSVKDGAGFSVYDVSDGLRARGWQVPAYPFSPDLEDLHVLRIVVRNGFSRDLGAMLHGDIERVVATLQRHGGRPADEHRAGFHH
jgi:glutamate decarboxylase